MPDPAALLEIRGVARGVDLRAFGCTRNHLATAVARGEIHRVRDGVFASHTAPPEVVTAAAHGGALTCAKALHHRGIWTLAEDDRPHVWLGAGGRPHPHPDCRCVVHFRAGTMRLGLADVEHALIHAFHCHGDEFFFAAFESAWNKMLIGSAARSRIRAALPTAGRWLVDLARPDAESGLESILRLRLHLLGIRLECQVRIPDVGRVDFVIEGRIILEADGKGNHDGLSHRHRDLQRDAAASRHGYETLRFDYAMIIHDWDTVLAAILAALARARA
ncbi:type IV toxin-antitoxin system AbiEi family antitoxin domain-containing protein [Microbacterium capsulatum]|uniref:Type IV toxin-antitoxin system AbiEi family antitoxin domain-containing protein n=1 Tax=Microbacterium capsulatum TaxID=3041921 RepID=A0ABU0XGN4_9MICO|nr:type IV toxin-antitoxin system AbiEi family antitoxin domain-containing protein [Microbacterium sp. ASV81]MDQ4214292.1 type IV toxin-antitoxin system AbiEi family antitoxin domain-containing protein [Microbacterium sp. ASV81]